MKLVVYVFGGLIGMMLLAVYWAMRVAAWLCSLACGLMLVWAMFFIGHPAECWRALGQAAVCFTCAVVLYMIPLMTISAFDPRRARVQRFGARFRVQPDGPV